MLARDGSVRAHALVDADRFDELSHYRWHLSPHGYVHRLTLISEEGRPRRRMSMHRQVLGLEFGDRRHVDHINRDKLDNRRANLRLTAGSIENLQNVGAREGATSRFRGVCWDAENARWVAQVSHAGKRHMVGRFRSEIAAALEAEAVRSVLLPFAQPDPELARLGLPTLIV